MESHEQKKRQCSFRSQMYFRSLKMFQAHGDSGRSMFQALWAIHAVNINSRKKGNFKKERKKGTKPGGKRRRDLSTIHSITNRLKGRGRANTCYAPLQYAGTTSRGQQWRASNRTGPPILIDLRDSFYSYFIEGTLGITWVFLKIWRWYPLLEQFS